MSGSRRIALPVALVGVAVLPLLADWIRVDKGRCELDGVQVQAGYRVRVIDAAGAEHRFCGVRCAELWLARSGTEARRIRVTDCASGREIDAREAWYLRTYAGWRDGAPDLIRVFASPKDAQRHAEAHGGEILPDNQRPFSMIWGAKQ